MTLVYDALIIGAGQAGPPLAGRLTAAGMSVALVERKLFGGTCVNTGCIPTKTLVASAYAAHLARRAAAYGVSTGGAVTVDMKAVKARKDMISTRARKGVESWLEGKTAVIEVADTGPGVPPSARARLFTAFSSSRSGGSGLGLVIAADLVHGHGGTITLVPNADEENSGAKFHITLPQAALRTQ